MIPIGWKEYKLGEVCTVIAGQSPESKYYNNAGNGMPFYQGKKEFTNRYIGETTVWTTNVTKVAQKGDILMSVRAPVGPINYATQTCCIGRGLASIRNSELLSQDFLFYFLLNIQDKISGHEGAVFGSINKTEIENLQIIIPSLSEQQRIVDKLDTLFADIEKEKQIVQQNLQNVKELFESESNTLLTSNTDDWTEKSLNDVCKTISAGGDKPPVCSDYETELCKVPIYSNGVANNGLYGYTDKPTVFEPAITVSARGTIGFVCKREQPFCPIVRLITLVPKEDIDLSFFAYVLKLVVPQNTGSSIPQLTVPNLKPQKIKYPDLATQKVIAQKLDTLREQTQELEQIYTQQIADLDELKQAILKKAFNGEL